MKPFSIEKIISSFEAELSEEENLELERWLAKSNTNQQYYNETKKVYETSKKVRLNFHPNENEALKKINRRLKMKKTVRWSYRVAAAVLLIFIVSKVILLPEKTLWHEITTENKQSIILPDSSKVILAENSTFRYPEKFDNKQRRVHLTGQAYFEVSENPESPFSVQTPNAKVEVLGTRFLVDASNDAKEEVIVDKGKVAFSSVDSPTKLVILTQSEIGTWNAARKTISKKVIEDKNHNAWLSSRLTFKDMPMWQLIETFEKHFNIKIELSDTKYEQIRFTGEFNSATADEALRIVCATMNLRNEKNGTKYILKL